MRNLACTLLMLSAVAFVLAVIFALLGRPFMGVAAEGFSRACTNLTLIAIALLLLLEKKAVE